MKQNANAMHRQSLAATVQALFTFPVKGFAPMALPFAYLECGKGLPHDRRFAVANGQQTVSADGRWTPW